MRCFMLDDCRDLEEIRVGYKDSYVPVTHICDGKKLGLNAHTHICIAGLAMFMCWERRLS